MSVRIGSGSPIKSDSVSMNLSGLIGTLETTTPPENTSGGVYTKTDTSTVTESARLRRNQYEEADRSLSPNLSVTVSKSVPALIEGGSLR